MHLPAKSFKELYHRGLLPDGPANTQASESHEGYLLSCAHSIEVSEAWIRMARLGGLPLWRLSCAPGVGFRLLAMHRMRAVDRSALLESACQLGLIVKKAAFRRDFADESDQAMFSLYRTMDEANTERDGDEDVVTEVCAYHAEPKLADLWNGRRRAASNQGISLAFVEDAAVAAVIDLQHDGFDGLFWNDELDPANYSAPRVGLFQRTVRGMNKRLMSM